MFLYSVGGSGTMSKQDLLSLTLPQVNSLLQSISKTSKKFDKKQTTGVTMTTPAMMKKMQADYRKKMGLE